MSSLIVHHDSHFAYWFGWLKCILTHFGMLPMFFDFHLFFNCITWGYWSLVMHEFTLALVGSINTFILDHYFLRRMLLVATPLNGWFQQVNKFQERRDHGYCVHKHRSMSVVVLIVDPLHVLWWQWGRWFDTYDSFELQLCSPQGLLDMVAGPGGRRLHGRLTPGKVAFPRSCRLPSARHPNEFSSFSICLRTFIPD